MKNFKILLLAVSLSFSSSVFSQVKFGAKAGLNFNDASFNLSEDFPGTSPMKAGFHLGAVLDYSFSEALSLRPELLFKTKGYKMKFEAFGMKSVSSYTLNYLEIPINVNYKINSFQMFAGPYLAFGLSGTNKDKFEGLGESDEDKYKLKPKFGEVGSDDYKDLADNEDFFRAFDFGFNLGVGYTLGPVLVNLDYSIGFVNTIPSKEEVAGEPSDDSSITNRVLSLSATYMFGQ
jgi:hypothetical protein